jgi:Homeodomain-like domain-containing protein
MGRSTRTTPTKAPTSRRAASKPAGTPAPRVPLAPGTRPARARATGQHGGRPSSLTEETVADIVRMLERGAYLTHAAAAVGVDRRTLYRWLEQGGADVSAGKRSEEADFFHRVGQARARGRVAMCQVIDDAAKRDWRAAAWMLERTDPELFGEKIEVNRRPEARGDAPPVDGSGAVEGDGETGDPLDVLSDGELELLEKLRAREVAILQRARSRRGAVE